MPDHVQFLQTSLEAQKMTVGGLARDIVFDGQDYGTINDRNLKV